MIIYSASFIQTKNEKLFYSDSYNLDFKELRNSKLNTLEGVEPDFMPIRAFRHPHHTSTLASIFGGGSTGGKSGI